MDSRDIIFQALILLWNKLYNYLRKKLKYVITIHFQPLSMYIYNYQCVNKFLCINFVVLTYI